MRKNVFVIGLDAFNLSQLQTVRGAEKYRFHGVLSADEVVNPNEYPIHDLLARAEAHLDAFRESGEEIAAIIGHYDFPTSTMLPILRRRYGLPGPTLESVLKCEHKYWSRLEQAKYIPEVTPRFAAFDPFDDDALSKIDMPYPFWVKPVKSHSSYLGFHIRNARDFAFAQAVLRERVGRMSGPFHELISRHADLPPEIADLPAELCLAEEIISQGSQCTLEGYVYDGEPYVYGVVDSVREPNRVSFQRYEYPSDLPRGVQRRMIEYAGRLLTGIGYDTAPFNMEFFYQKKTDRIMMLEVNSRISKSHCPLFEMVDGNSHQEVALQLGLGKPPLNFIHSQGEGRFRHAAKFHLRAYADGWVTRAPTDQEIAALCERFPGSAVLIDVQPGQRLSELQNQDSYSYELGVVFVGANTQQALLDRYRVFREELKFRFSAVDVTAPVEIESPTEEEAVPLVEAAEAHALEAERKEAP